MNVQNISFFAHFSYFILFKFKSFGVKVLSQSWRKNENFLLSNESGRFSFFFFGVRFYSFGVTLIPKEWNLTLKISYKKNT